MKDLLFVIDSLNSGGAEKSLVNLLNEIDYTKYNVDLQLFSHNNFLLELLPQEVNILPLPPYFEMCKNSLAELLENRKIKLFLARVKSSFLMRVKNNKKNHILQTQWECIRNSIEINPKRYDIAIAYSQGIPTYYVKEKVISDKKIAWINCLYSQTRYNKIKDHEYYKAFKKLVVVSEKSKEDFLSVFPDYKNKVYVIYDFISKKIVENMSNEHFEWQDNFNGIRITSILRLEWVKGPDIILECCRKMKSMNISFKWYLIGGGGSMSDEIKSGIEKYNLTEYLILLGPQINPFKFVQNSDIYIQASRIEGYCMALAEAKMLNVGIISTNFLLVKEHIEDGVNGCICEPDSESMTEKVLYMLNNKDFREKTITNRKDKLKNYNKELEKFYQLID